MFTLSAHGYNVSNAGVVLGTASPLGAPLQHPQTLVAMIDRHSYKRKVLIMEHCLILAKAYYDQDDFKQADRYSLLASEYFGEILGFVEKPECLLGK